MQDEDNAAVPASATTALETVLRKRQDLTQAEHCDDLLG
jgi:hypothetical protein